MAEDLDPDACPCCSPPWLFNTSFIQPIIYFAWKFGTGSGTPSLIRAYDLSGVFIGTIHTLTGAYSISDIAVERSTGNIYFVTRNASVNILRALDSAGATLWTATFPIGHNLEAVAVDNAGFVYSGQRVIRKFDSATGTEVTTGGWPHTPSGGLFTVLGLSCDQTGSLYVCGGQNLPYNRNVFALDSSGSMTWENDAESADVPSIRRTATSIAVNGAGDELVVTAGGAASGYHDEYTFDPVTGTKLTEVVSGLTGAGFGSGANGLQVSGYDKDDNYYTGGVNGLRKNGSSIFTYGGVSRAFFHWSIAFENENNVVYGALVYLTGTGDKFNLCAIDDSGTKLWSLDANNTQIALTAVESSRGRIGAFGP